MEVKQGGGFSRPGPASGLACPGSGELSCRAVIFFRQNRYSEGLTVSIQEAVQPGDQNCHLHP